jgi:hypothetical protein
LLQVSAKLPMYKPLFRTLSVGTMQKKPQLKGFCVLLPAKHLKTLPDFMMPYHGWHLHYESSDRARKVEF